MAAYVKRGFHRGVDTNGLRALRTFWLEVLDGAASDHGSGQLGGRVGCEPEVVYRGGLNRGPQRVVGVLASAGGDETLCGGRGVLVR